MMIRVLLLAAVASVLLSNYVQGLATTADQFRSSCHQAEQSYLFNQCLMPFGYAHWRDRAAMMKSTGCLREKLQCGAAKTAVDCMNALPTSGVSPTCWAGLVDTLSHMMLTFRFGCSFRDVEAQCGSIVPTLNLRTVG